MKKHFEFVHRSLNWLKRDNGTSSKIATSSKAAKEAGETKTSAETGGIEFYEPEPFEPISDFPSLDEFKERNRHELKKRKVETQANLALFVICFCLLAHFFLIYLAVRSNTSLDAAKYFWTGAGPIVGIFAKMIWDAWND